MKKMITALLILATALSVLSGCAANTGKKPESESTKSEPTTVSVGVGNAWKPYCYLDENGNLDGYEVAVLKAADELLPDYTFDLQALDWNNVLVSLDAGKVDIAGHSFQLNDERKEKYGYTDEIYCQYVVYLVVAKNNDTIKGLDDLAGKNVLAVTGEASTQKLEAYNEANPDKKLNLQYSSLTTEQIVAAIDNGTLDAWFTTQNVLDEMNANYGDKLKFTGEPILVENTVFFIDKENTALKTALDGAIAELHKSGKLADLSTQYLGGDFTKAAE